jgi:hypothetical protein
MKKILLFVLMAVGTASFAQVEKGDFNATANVSFQSDMPDVGDATNMSQIGVRAGYYFTNNIEAGAAVQVIGASDLTMTGFGPYAVYNFLTAGGKFLPYVGANYYRFDFGSELVDPIAQIGGFGGFKYFLTEVVNVDTSLNYTSWLGDAKGATLRLNVGIGINFGKLK